MIGLTVKDDIVPMLDEIKSMIRVDGEEIKTRLYNLELVTRGICQQIKFQPSSLPLRIPVAPASSAPSPALSSATSAISSASESSGVHVPRMAMPGPPSAGPSGSGPSKIQREYLSNATTDVPLNTFSAFVAPPARSGRQSRSREPSKSGSRAPSMTRQS